MFVVLSAGKVEFPCNRSFVPFVRWYSEMRKRRLRPHSCRTPVAHATALPSDGADKTSRVLNRVEHQGHPRVQCQSAKNSNGHNNLLSWTTINCRWLLRIKDSSPLSQIIKLSTRNALILFFIHLAGSFSYTWNTAEVVEEPETFCWNYCGNNKFGLFSHFFEESQLSDILLESFWQ